MSRTTGTYQATAVTTRQVVGISLAKWAMMLMFTAAVAATGFLLGRIQDSGLRQASEIELFLGSWSYVHRVSPSSWEIGYAYPPILLWVGFLFWVPTAGLAVNPLRAIGLAKGKRVRMGRQPGLDGDKTLRLSLEDAQALRNLKRALHERGRAGLFGRGRYVRLGFGLAGAGLVLVTVLLGGERDLLSGQAIHYAQKGLLPMVCLVGCLITVLGLLLSFPYGARERVVVDALGNLRGTDEPFVPPLPASSSPTLMQAYAPQPPTVEQGYCASCHRVRLAWDGRCATCGGELVDVGVRDVQPPPTPVPGTLPLSVMPEPAPAALGAGVPAGTAIEGALSGGAGGASADVEASEATTLAWSAVPDGSEVPHQEALPAVAATGGMLAAAMAPPPLAGDTVPAATTIARATGTGTRQARPGRRVLVVGLVAGAVVVLLGGFVALTVVGWSRDRSAYRDGHAAYLVGDCTSAVAGFDRVLGATPVIRLGGFDDKARDEQAECQGHLDARDLAAADPPGALLAYGDLVAAYPSTDLKDNAVEGAGALIAEHGAAAVVTERSCDALASLVDAGVVSGPDVPAVRAACVSVYAGAGRADDTEALAATILTEHAVEPAAAIAAPVLVARVGELTAGAPATALVEYLSLVQRYRSAALDQATAAAIADLIAVHGVAVVSDEASCDAVQLLADAAVLTVEQLGGLRGACLAVYRSAFQHDDADALVATIEEELGSACDGRAIPWAAPYAGDVHPLAVVDPEGSSASYAINEEWRSGSWAGSIQLVVCVPEGREESVEAGSCGNNWKREGDGVWGELIRVKYKSTIRVVIANTGETLQSEDLYGTVPPCGGEADDYSSLDLSVDPPWFIFGFEVTPAQVNEYATAVSTQMVQ